MGWGDCSRLNRLGEQSVLPEDLRCHAWTYARRQPRQYALGSVDGTFCAARTYAPVTELGRGSPIRRTGREKVTKRVRFALKILGDRKHRSKECKPLQCTVRTLRLAYQRLR